MFRRVLASLLGTVRVRLALAGIELQEEVDHVVRAIAMALAGTLLLCIGLTFAAIAVIVALWESHRVLALTGFAMLFTGAGSVFLWCLARVSRDRPPMFAETIAQFEEDRRRLAAHSAEAGQTVRREAPGQ